MDRNTVKIWLTESEAADLYSVSIRCKPRSANVTEYDMPPMHNPDKIGIGKALELGVAEKQIMIGLLTVDDLMELRAAIDLRLGAI